MVQKIKIFLQDSFQELKRVNWPSSKETVHLTLAVISISLVVAILLGAFDFLFSYILSRFLS